MNAAVGGVILLGLVSGGFPACAGSDGGTNDSGAEEEGGTSFECTLEPASDPEWAEVIGCHADFLQVAAAPLDASIPGALSVKTVIDQFDEDNLYFQNSNKYLIHHQFCQPHLSGNGLPIVPALGQFNQTEYYSPSRRFLLGAVTYYEGPDVFVYEIAPYDTSTAGMIAKAYEHIAASAYFGDQLYFHPTSLAVEVESANLPDSVKLISTDDLFQGINFQPLNLGISYGRLRHISAKELETEYLDFREIVVLDAVPNDISVVSGIITSTYQTPLSHINVLSQNRGTPNMAAIGVFEDGSLMDLDGEWVRFEVTAFEWSLTQSTKEEADTWWEENKPDPVNIPPLDLSVEDLRDMEDMLDLESDTLEDALAKAIPAFGGKGSHYGAFPHMDAEKCPTPKAFGIPVYYYDQFMKQHGFDDYVAQMLTDEKFQNDPAERDKQLAKLRDAMQFASLDAQFLKAVEDKISEDHDGARMRFRSSTNCEDLDGFTGAGLYTSLSGDLNDPGKSVADAIRGVWASIWFFRAFEERTYRSIDHNGIGMALLVHRSFPDEEANGVALTGNIFDTTGLEPGFYVNVQMGGASVVKPEFGTQTDQFIYHYDMPGQPIVFLAHSSLIEEGTTVLTNKETYALGTALKEIHTFFFHLYGPPSDNPTQFYGMDVEFKFDGEPGEDPKLYVKQARPHAGWGG
jgi:hypothetical protein